MGQSKRYYSNNPFDDEDSHDETNDGTQRQVPRISSMAFTPEDEKLGKYIRTRQGRSAPLVFSNPFQDPEDRPAAAAAAASEYFSAGRSPQRNPYFNVGTMTPQRNAGYEAGTITNSEMSPLLPDDLSRGYQSSGTEYSSPAWSSTRRKITVPSRIFTGSVAEPSPFHIGRRDRPRRRKRDKDESRPPPSNAILTELATGDDNDPQHDHMHMEYKYILLEDLGTAASWLILVLPYATFFFTVFLLYFLSVPVATMGSLVTALRISCFLVTFAFSIFWIRKMDMLRYFCCGCGRFFGYLVNTIRNCFVGDDDKNETDETDLSGEIYWWENPWVLFPERYYVLPLLLSSLLVFEPIMVAIYFVPTLGTPTLYAIGHGLSGVGIQACSLIYLCLIQGFRYHTGERSKRRAELQRKVLQLRRAVKFVEDSKDDHQSFIKSPKVVQNYYDEFGDVDGSAFTAHLRLPNDPCADVWADFLLPKILVLLVGIFSASMIAFSRMSVGKAMMDGKVNANEFIASGNMYVIGSMLYGMTLSVWTILTIGALYTTGEKLKREPFLGTRPVQLAYRILFAHSGIAIVGLGIASMEYFGQIKGALEHESIVKIMKEENVPLVHPGDISFAGLFGRLVCLTAQVVITAFIFLPPHTMDFDKDWEDDEQELTDLQILNKNRTDKRLVVHLAKHSKTWRIFPCPIQAPDETQSPFQDHLFQVYKDFHTDRNTHQRGIVSIGPYIPVFCAELACWLNEASWQAYNSPIESSIEDKAYGNNYLDREDDFVGWMRLDLIGLQLEGYVYDERTNTQAYIASNSAAQVDGDEDSVIVVAFRGTSDATNVKTDFRVRQVPLHDQITGIGEGVFRVYPDRVEVNDSDGWIWDTNPKSGDLREHIRCVDCWTERTPPCTPTYTSAVPPQGRQRTYSVGNFDGKVSKETADILKGAPLARNSFPMVHEGFQDAYSEIRKQLFELLLPVLQRQLAKSIKSGSSQAGANDPLALPKIYCTGHSLGGSLAQLFALDLAANCEIVLPVKQPDPPLPLFRAPSPFGDAGRFFPKSPSVGLRASRELRLQPPIGVYTYGQPRVGNKAFSRLYKQRVPHSFRVVNEGDAFTTIPNYFWCGGLYKHAGLEVILDAGMTGNVLVGPTVVETLFRFHKVRTNVMAHQMERYRECLECIFDESQLLEYCQNHNISYEELRQASGGRDKDRKYEDSSQQKGVGGISEKDGLDWYA